MVAAGLVRAAKYQDITRDGGQMLAAARLELDHLERLFKEVRKKKLTWDKWTTTWSRSQIAVEGFPSRSALHSPGLKPKLLSAPWTLA